MAFGFPIYIDLKGNNCVIVGGGDYAASCVQTLLEFDAKITVIAPEICPALNTLEEAGRIRHIPRKYYRGDCTFAYLCVAATDDEAVNIDVSDECKAKGIPVHVSRPSAFGTFRFPVLLLDGDVSVALEGRLPREQRQRLCDKIREVLPAMRESLDTDPSEN